MKISFIQSEQQHLVALLMSFLKTLPYMVNEDRSIYYVKKDMDPLFDLDKGYLRNIVDVYSDKLVSLNVDKLNPLQVELITKHNTVNRFCSHVLHNNLSHYISRENITQGYIDVENSLRERFASIFGDEIPTPISSSSGIRSIY